LPPNPALIAENWPTNDYQLSELTHSTNYFWKVVAYDSQGDSTESEIWKFTTLSSLACGSSFIDERDGKSYSTVQIDDKCWMAENLNYGLRIDGIYDMSDNGTVEKYCYDNDESNCDNFGSLYQWNELMNYSNIEGSVGICPIGWHVPSDLEWFNMTNYLDPTVTDINLQSWQGANIGLQLIPDGSSGFDALFSGRRKYEDGGYVNKNIKSIFWTSTIDPNNTPNSWFRTVQTGNPQIFKNGAPKLNGLACRCIKD